MDGQFDLITLISLIVAVAAIVKLRSVLGHRTDDDDKRVERLRTREGSRPAGPRPLDDGATGEVIAMPRRDRDRDQPAGTVAAGTDALTAETRVRAYPVQDPAVTDGLLAIAKLDPAFDPAAFVKGAGRAYEMIVSAFSEGNRKLLKDLLAREVYDGFVAAITDRERVGDRVEQQFVGIRKADIVDAEVKGGTAYITMRFVSELITARLNRQGEVVEGDQQRIRDVTDVWTFSRDVSSARARANPNWRLEETQAPN